MRPLFPVLRALTLCTATLALAACQSEQPGGDVSRAGPPPVLVETWTAHTSAVVDTVEAIGTLAGNESVEITPKVTDQVRAVHFSDGEMVTAGQVLVELADDEQRALLQEAEANYSEALLQRDRLRKLGGDISTEAQIDVAEARVKASAARLEAIRARIEDRLIRAPFDGLLGFREISTGALVTPGTVITRLDDISRLKLDFSVPETHFARLAVGTRVEAKSPAWPEETFSGEVISIDSRIDPVTRAVTVRALVDNRALQLRPGMLMSVVLLASKRQVLVLPEEALIQQAGSSLVYLVNGDQLAERREVQIGRRLRGGVVIEQGLAAGEEVVVNGQFNLRPGAPVKPVNTSLAGSH